MFCTHCGKEQDNQNQFCLFCGVSTRIPMSTFTPLPPASKPSSFSLYLFIIVALNAGILLFSVYTITELKKPLNESSTIGSEEDIEYEANILTELEYSIEPIGYFDDMSVFDSETISTDEWLSHIVPLVSQTSTQTLSEREKIYSAVVKIVCEDDEYFYYGSGTNVDPSGYILTNHHVVEGLAQDACMVGFPDPISGLIKEAYWTNIVTEVANETGHDLAYLVIDKPVFDEEGNVYGYHDRIFNSSFPYFEHTEQCLDTVYTLGEKILVLGYPPLSGTALTVTDGLISSFYSPNGYIITSAKIVSGNSGGLAINENGCYVGVPTAFYFDETDTDSEVLGEIIDWEFVNEFDAAIEDDLQVFYKEQGIVEFDIPKETFSTE